MQLIDKFRTATAIARVRAHMRVERLTDRHPKRLSDIPTSVDVITREWLTAALCGKVAGAGVVGFDLGGLNVGTTSRRSIHVRYSEAGQRAGLPERVFGKATPQFTTRLVCGLSGAIASEVNFYNVIRPLLDIETLNCYFAAFHPGSYRSILLFDDISYTKNARFLDPHHRFTRPQADSMIDAMAGMHSRFWGSKQLAEFVWIKDALSYQHHINKVIDFRKVTLAGVSRTASILPEAIRTRQGELWPALMRSCELRVAGARTLLHADIHPGNWYLAGNGQLGLSDWQCTTTGLWAADVAYALSSCLAIDDRRAWERDLIGRYLSRLRLPDGQTVPSLDDAWLAYGQQVMHGLFNWFFVAGAGAMQPSMQPDDFGRINLERMATAAVDLKTLDSLAI